MSESSIGSNHPIATCNGEEYRGIRQIIEQNARRTVGEVMQFIETLGLEEKRENAFKAIVKRNLWSSMEDELACLQWKCPNGAKEWKESGIAEGIALPE